MRINDIEYIEVEVLDVRSAAQASEAFSLILTERHNPSHYVPIIIGLNEARAILGEKYGRMPQRPLTHTLFADLLTDHIPDYNLEFVSIDEFHDGIYYASIVIQAPTGVYFNVDARPSDALAIALRTRIPSYFRKDLFENQNVALGTQRPAAKRHRRGELRTGGEDSGGDRQERGLGGSWLVTGEKLETGKRLT